MRKRIPTILAVFLTVVLVGGLAVATSQMQKVTSLFSSHASQNVSPTSPVTIANISDSGFTVYWTTDQESLGTVSWGKAKNTTDTLAIDDRGSGNYVTHFIRVVGLTAQTKYYFKVTGDQTIYDATTLEKATNASPTDPIFGKVMDASGVPAAGAIVTWEATPAARIASLSSSDGSFVLPVESGVKVTSETITLNASQLGKASIICTPGLDKPLPTVKLGENLDCNKSQNITPTGFQPPASSSGQLIIDLTNGETVSSTLPTFAGKAGANQVVKIEVHSTTIYSGTVKAEPDGSWSWTPPNNLAPGQHTVTITVVNADGTTQTVTRTFNVDQGESLLPVTSGTPSGTLFHWQCLNNACTQVSGAGPDSCAIDSDCVVVAPTATPSATPIPTPIIYPPKTGTTENALILLTLGLLFATLGVWIQRQF